MKDCSAYLDHIRNCALKAVLSEVAASPKPGLVDRFGNGANRDMDYFTFLSSTVMIMPYFEKMALEGERFGQLKKCLCELMDCIRQIGVRCEAAMFEATGGINTQKGIVFSVGIISTAAAYTYASTGGTDALSICKTVKGMTARILDDFKVCRDGAYNTGGERLYVMHGIAGIRKEAHEGFPVAMRCGLPVMKDLVKQGCHPNEAYVHTLLHIMTQLTDTNVIARHNLQTLKYVQDAARRVLDEGGALCAKGRQLIREMDEDFIRRNISPGGSADTLCITILLYELGLWQEKIAV